MKKHEQTSRRLWNFSKFRWHWFFWNFDCNFHRYTFRFQTLSTSSIRELRDVYHDDGVTWERIVRSSSYLTRTKIFRCSDRSFTSNYSTNASDEIYGWYPTDRWIPRIDKMILLGHAVRTLLMDIRDMWERYCVTTERNRREQDAMKYISIVYFLFR